MTFRNSGRRYRAARQVGTWSGYTKPLELITSKTFNKNIIDKFFSDCDTSRSILRHDELQIWGLGTVGALTIRANGLGTWGDLDGLGHWGTSGVWSDNRPTCQSAGHQINPTNPTGHSVNRLNFQTQYALANRSGIFHLRPC